MALIKLGGRWAVGHHQYAIIDDDMEEVLSRHAWKAKPNGGGNNVYAVRNVLVGGTWVTLRMHRVALGLERSDPRDVDHINHDALDNRRANLRAVTRSENLLNARMVTVIEACTICRATFSREVHASAAHRCRSHPTCPLCQGAATRGHPPERQAA